MAENQALPSIESMEQNLEQSGQLLHEIPIHPNQPHTQTGPLKSLQPDNMIQTENGPQPLIAHTQMTQETNEVQLATTYRQPKFSWDSFSWIHKPIAITLALVLTLQGLYGIYDSIKFLMVDYPQLEALLITHQLDEKMLTELVIKTAILLIASLIGMIFSLRLMRRNSMQLINMIIGFFFIFLTLYLQKLFEVNADLAVLIPTVTPASNGNMIQDLLHQFSL